VSGVLEGKVALVTGAGTGLGRGIAQALAEAGADVAVAEINGESGEVAARELAETGVRAKAYETDVAKSDQVERAFTSCVADLGRLDIVVNNAGITKDTLLPIMSDDDWDQVIAANLPLNGDEAARFWPLYDAYTQETIKVNDQRYALVKEYAANYATMTDTLAASYIRRWIQVDEAGSKLRLEWIPKFEQTLGEKKAAIFFQIDHRIGLMMELQLAAQLPLIQP